MKMHRITVRKAGAFVAVAAVIAALLTITWTGGVSAQDLLPKESAESEDAVVLPVGSYEPQKAFEQYPGRNELLEEFQSAQEDMTKAQEQGDQQKLQQIQMKLQQKQQQVIDQFQRDVEAALPDVAKAAEVQVIAVEIAYTAEGVKTKDVTSQVVSALSERKTEDAPARRERAVPGLPAE